MKILEFNKRFTQTIQDLIISLENNEINKICEFNWRIMKVIKIIEFIVRTMKNHEHPGI